MKRRAVALTCISVGLVSLLAGCGGGQKPDPAPEPAPAPIEPELAPTEPLSRGWMDPSELTADGRVLVGAQPDPAGLTRFATGGGTLVIDLRTDDEHTYEVGFDEAQLAESLGLAYERIPVEAAAFGVEEVLRLAELVSLARGKVLLHCDSGNRSAGLWAAYLVLVENEGVDESVEVARVMGMRKAPIEDRVRELARAAKQ